MKKYYYLLIPVLLVPLGIFGGCAPAGPGAFGHCRPPIVNNIWNYAVCPQNSALAIVVTAQPPAWETTGGSGEGHLVRQPGCGVYKTVDYGVTWEEITNNAIDGDGNPIPFLSAYIVDEQTYWLGSNGYGMFKTTNGGETWQVCDNFPCDVSYVSVWHIDGNQDNPDEIYFCSFDMNHFEYTGEISADSVKTPDAKGAFRSLDGGVSWEQINNGFQDAWAGVDLPLGMGKIGVYLQYYGFWIAVSQADPNVLYYAHPGIYVHVTGVPVIGSIDINSPARMYKSTDKGGNWTKSREFPVPKNTNCVIDLSDLMSGLKIEDLNAASFYVAPGIDDGNLACSSLVNAVSFFGNLFGAVVEAPQSEYREEWGMAKCTDQGSSWVMKNTGLPVGDDVGNVYTICPAIAPSSPDTMYVGVQDKGVYKSMDGAESWSEDTEHNAYIDTESDRGTGASLAIAEDGRLWMSLTYINKNDQGTLTDVEDDVPYGESYNPLLTTDDENPSAVADLLVEAKGIGTAELSWSAAGDEGEKGRATNYIVKYSSAEITGENFDECAAAYPFVSYECEQLQHDGYDLVEDDGDALNGCSLLCNAGPEGEALVLYGPSVAHQFNPGKDYAANFRMRRWEGDSLKRLGFLYATADGGETNYSGAQYSQANFPDTFYHELPVVFSVSSSDQQWEFRNTFAHRGEEVRYDRVTIVPSPPKGEKITCRVNNLSPGEWHFAVKAMDKVGKLSAISNPVSCDIATIVPENLSALSGFGPLSIDLSWDECAEAAGYFVYRSTYEDGEYAPISPSYPEDFETMQLSRGGAEGPEDEGDAIKTKQSFSPGTSYWLVVDADCQYSDSFDGSVGVWFWVDNQNYLDFYYKIEGGSQTWAYKFGKGEPVTAESNVMKDFAPSVKKHLRLVHTGEKIKLYLNGSKVWADIDVGNAWQDKEIKVCFQADGGDAPEFKQFFGNRKVRKLVLNTAFHDVCPEFQEYYYKVSAVGLSGIGDVEEMWDNPSAESSLSELAWCLAAALDEIAPAPVTDLQAFTPSEGAENGSLRLTWTATGDDGTAGTATRYILKFSAEGPPDFDQAKEYTQSWQPLDSGQREEKMLGGFRPASTYWFALKVVDEADNLSDRDTIFPRPFAVAFQDTTPPAAITGLTGWDAASLPGEPEDRNGKWILSWTAPGDDGLSGTVSAYVVHYATYDVSLDSWSWENTLKISGEFIPPQLVGPGENQQLVLTGLEMLVDTTSQMTYYFLVRAADESYFMPEDWGLPVNYSTPAKIPGSPKLFPPSRAPVDSGNTVCLSPTEIKWCWEDKSLWERGYQVYDGTTVLKELLADTESWTESGTTLLPNQSYSRVIEPFNAAGASTTTLTLSCYSLANRPEGLTVLSSLPPTSTTVSLSWSPASEGGNNGYHVEWYDREKKDWLNVSGLLPETSTTYTITGLAENTRNWFRVWGYNAELARTAEPTDKIAVWTTKVPPVWTKDKPLSAAAPEGIARQIRLEWYEAGDPPEIGGTPGEMKQGQYFVKMATFAFTDWDTPGLTDLGGEEDSLKPYKPGLKKQYDVENLDGDTKYWFAVRAMDEARVYSDMSNVVSAKPLKGVAPPQITTILKKTMNPRPLIKGTAVPGLTVVIYDNGEEIGRVTVDSEGNWTFTPETPLPVGTHKITAIAWRGSIPGGISSSVSAACEFAVEPPAKTCLYLAGPIPFNPNEGDLVFNFDLHEGCPVKLIIYNIAGERVRKLIDNEDLTAGRYGRSRDIDEEYLHWKGMNDDGEDIASGVYFYYFKAGDKKPEIKKLLLIRKK